MHSACPPRVTLRRHGAIGAIGCAVADASDQQMLPGAPHTDDDRHRADLPHPHIIGAQTGCDLAPVTQADLVWRIARVNIP